MPDSAVTGWHDLQLKFCKYDSYIALVSKSCHVHQEGEPDVDMFLDENMWSQNLSDVFLFKNFLTHGSCSLVIQLQANIIRFETRKAALPPFSGRT